MLATTIRFARIFRGTPPDDQLGEAVPGGCVPLDVSTATARPRRTPSALRTVVRTRGDGNRRRRGRRRKVRRGSRPSHPPRSSPTPRAPPRTSSPDRRHRRGPVLARPGREVPVRSRAALGGGRHPRYVSVALAWAASTLIVGLPERLAAAYVPLGRHLGNPGSLAFAAPGHQERAARGPADAVATSPVDVDPRRRIGGERDRPPQERLALSGRCAAVPPPPSPSSARATRRTMSTPHSPTGRMATTTSSAARDASSTTPSSLAARSARAAARRRCASPPTSLWKRRLRRPEGADAVIACAGATTTESAVDRESQSRVDQHDATMALVGANAALPAPLIVGHWRPAPSRRWGRGKPDRRGSSREARRAKNARGLLGGAARHRRPASGTRCVSGGLRAGVRRRLGDEAGDVTVQLRFKEEACVGGAFLYAHL